MKRILMVLAAAIVMAAVMGASALPALAQGPPTTFSALPDPAVNNVLYVADPLNPVIDINDNNACLDTPGPGFGHHSGYPDDKPCQQ